jgi:hypothetical protein
LIISSNIGSSSPDNTPTRMTGVRTTTSSTSVGTPANTCAAFTQIINRNPTGARKAMYSSVRKKFDCRASSR